LEDFIIDEDGVAITFFLASGGGKGEGLTRICTQRRSLSSVFAEFTEITARKMRIEI
jgi:hypothetical protein